MAILKVARLGHPVLRRPASPVPPEEVRTPEIQRLIDDMIETMREYDGAGLASNQVHTLKQIVRLQCLDRAGQPVDVVAKEFFARFIQHETDHLNGVVYLDRMPDLSTLSHIAEWNKHWLGLREQND